MPSHTPPAAAPATAPPAKKAPKRKADGDDAGGGGEGEGKSKRNRVHFSCVECNRRKQKCDRQTPCSHCIARKVPHLCRPFVNGVEDPNHYEQDVRSRLDRIEDMLKDIRAASIAPASSSSPRSRSPHTQHGASLSSHAGPSGSHYLPPININGRPSSSASPQSALQPLRPSFSSSAGAGSERGGADEEQEDEDGEGQMGTMTGGRFYGPSAMSSVSSSRMNKILQDFPTTAIGAASLSLPLPSPKLPSLPSAVAASSGPTPSSGRHRLYPPGSLPPKFESAMETLDESGISLENIISLLDKLPERGMRNALMELYWREIDWTRYHVYQPSFQARYIHFFSHETDQNLQNAYPWQNLDAASLKWLPLLFIMMAIATLTAPLELFGDEDKRRSMSRKLYGSARKAMNIAQALQRDNVDIVMAGLLIARYLLLVHRAAEGFTPLTAALQLGLYRDGTHLGMGDKREIELRRRLWSYIIHHDRTASLLVGRPTLIPAGSVDTLPPANLDDHDLLGDFPPEGKPMSQPTVMTHAVLRHALAVIMGKISEKIFSLRSPHYSTVVELDQELIEWKYNLPSYFKLEHPDKSMDGQYHYLAFHRQMLASEFYYTRILLHRPFILRRRDSNQYDYSRRAAIEAARADLIGRREFQLNKPAHLGKLSVAAYWVLNSYIIIGIAILLDPQSSQANELRNLLNVVTGRTPDEDGRVSIATVRELAIVELFSQKEKNINAASLPSSPAGSSAPNPAFPHGFTESSPFASSSKPYSAGGADSSPGGRRPSERPEHDFLAPPRNGSLSSLNSSAPATGGLSSATQQLASPGLWGRPDPVDELLLSYHRAKGDSLGDATNALQSQMQGQSAAASSSGIRPGQGSANDSAWSAKAIGMGDHKFSQPFSQSPHSLASPQLRPAQTLPGLTFQPSPFSLSGSSAAAGVSSSSRPDLQHLPSSSSSTSAHAQFGGIGSAADGVFGGGLGGTAFDQTDFTSPWTHGVHAFSGATGVAGSTESPDAGDGFGDLLGDAKEIAFLNQLISAISSGDGPSL